MDWGDGWREIGNREIAGLGNGRSASVSECMDGGAVTGPGDLMVGGRVLMGAYRSLWCLGSVLFCFLG